MQSAWSFLLKTAKKLRTHTQMLFLHASMFSEFLHFLLIFRSAQFSSQLSWDLYPNNTVAYDEECCEEINPALPTWRKQFSLVRRRLNLVNCCYAQLREGRMQLSTEGDEYILLDALMLLYIY